MQFFEGVLVGVVVLAAVLFTWRSLHTSREPSAPEAIGMQSALHAATSTLPHLRVGLHTRSAD